MPRYNQPPTAIEMEMQSTFEDGQPAESTYKQWDEKRRRTFPDAKHVQWETFDNQNRVACWNPHNGRAWVTGQ